MSPRFLAGLLLAAAAGPALAQTGSAPFVGYNFTGITRAQTATLDGFGLEPPDTMGAVGINQFVQFNNGSFNVFNKDGTLATARLSDGGFWTAAGVSITAANLSDPRILWDAASQRWIAVEISVNEATNNRILIARSTGTSAAGPFNAATLTTTGGYFADYPTLGMNGDAIAISTNNFNAAGTANISVSTFNLPKSTLYSPTLATFTSLTALTRFESQVIGTIGAVPHPAVNYDGTTTGTIPVLADRTTTNLARTNITGSGAAGATTAATVNYTINALSVQPDAPQPGTATLQATGDTRLSSSPVQVGSRIFLAHSTASGGVSAIRFTVVDAGATTVVAQQTLTASGSYFSYPSVGVNTLGDVVIGFTATLPGPLPASYPAGVPAASAAVIIGVETSPGVFQFRTDALGNPVPTLLQNGSGGYTGTRWGDYSATTPDPADPRIFWTTQEYSNQAGASGNAWATQVSEVIVPNASDARWLQSTSGSRAFATAANWYAGTVPLATDHVIFSRWTSVANSQTVTTAANTTVDRLSVRQTGAGTLTLSLAPGTTFTTTNGGTTTPSLAVAEFQGQAALTVGGGGTLNTLTAIVAGTAGGTGVLTIDAAGTAWNNSGGAFVGGTATAAGGQGTLAVTNGGFATVSGLLTVYNAPSAALLNTVTVGSAGSGANLTAGGLTNTGAGSFAPTVTLANVASVLAITDTGSFSGVISGPGRVVKTATGNQTLSGANTYSGGTTLSGGTLSLASPTAVGTGTLGIGTNVVLANGTAGPLTLTANNAQAWGGNFSTTGPALNLGTGGVSISASPYAVVTVGAGGLTVGGPVSGGGTGLNKAGPGTLTLTGTNAYTGVTQVAAGTLALTGTGTLNTSPAVSVIAGTLDASGLTGGASFGSATARYNVPAGQTLDGGGTVSGGLTVASGGTLRPGSPFSAPNSPLAVSGGSASLLSGSTLSLRITDGSLPSGAAGASTIGALPNPTSNNFLDVTGGALTVGSTLTVVIDGTGTTFTQGSAYSYSIGRSTGVASIGTGYTFSPVGFSFSSASLSTNGTVVFLNFTPVPEPATVLAVAAGGLLAVRRIRRRG